MFSSHQGESNTQAKDIVHDEFRNLKYRIAPPDSVALHHYPYWHDLPAMRS